MLCVDGATDELIAARFFDPLTNQLSFAWDPGMCLILGGWLYNGATPSAHASKHGTLPSSHEATAPPSTG
jgi:hypothetical protein